MADIALESLGLVGSKGRVRIFTTENIGLAAQHGYISVTAELSGVFTPPFLTVPNDIKRRPSCVTRAVAQNPFLSCA